MISLKNIHPEYKSTALVGFIALVLSFLTGFLAGIRWNVVVLRSFILMVVFAAIGFGAIVILRKFVPEIYDLLASTQREPELEEAGKDTGYAEEAGASAAVPDIDEEGTARSSGEAEAPAEVAADEFKEIDKDALSRYSTAAGAGGPVNTGKGKLGKHILEKEKLAKYEPKIMAQAVRTMMFKDRE
jgi:hypothetical protein